MATSWPISANTGTTASIEVGIAWGADLTADPTTWSWTEVTTDVYDNPGIATSRGRGDEASTSQPASLTLELDNSSGNYSVGGQSSNWPYVRQGTPVRVRVNPDGSGLVTLFQGTADGFTPMWPYHSVPRVKLSASGTLRRLGQGAPVLHSALRRSITADSRCVTYWPCEEGKRAQRFMPAIGTGALTWSGAPDMASESYFECSNPLPKLKLGHWSGKCNNAGTSDFTVRFLAKFADSLTSSGANNSTVMTVFTSGTIRVWALRFITSGAASGEFKVQAYDKDLVLVYDSGAFTAYVCLPVMGVMISLVGDQNGADVDFSYSQSAILDDSANTFGFTDTIAGRTCGNVSGIWVSPEGTLDQVAIGHIATYGTALSYYDGLSPARAYRTEYADTRLERLETETGEAVDLHGISWVTMGPQTPDTLLNVMREIETADGGVLYDGETHGLSYVTREERENREPADLTLDATSSQVKPTFAPTHDDQRIRNKVEVTRKAGGVHMAEQTTGYLSTDAIGTYDTSVTANVYDDNQAEAMSGWLLNLGTVEGYRYPTITVNLGASPTLISDVLALKPGYRIDITNLDSALTSHPGPSTLSLAVEGIEHHLSAMSWTVTLKCSPYWPWKVLQLDDSEPSPVSYVSSSAVASSDNTSLSVTRPTAYDGDDLIVLVASIRSSGTGTVNTPTGWEVLLTYGNVSVFGRLEPREFDSADNLPSTTTVSFTGGAAGDTCLAQMFALRGTAAKSLGTGNLASVVAGSSTQLNGSAQNVAIPALTVSTNQCGIFVLAWKQDDYTSTTNPYSYTDLPIAASSTTGNDASMAAAFDVQDAHANISSGTYTFTGGASAISRGIVMAFKPDPNPLPAPQMDTAGSTLSGSIAQGATSMSVATTAGDLSMVRYIGDGGFAVGNNASVTPALPTLPSGWAADATKGDVLLAIASIRNSGTGTVNTPAGWTALVTSGNFVLLGKVAAPGDAAPTITFSNGVANATTMAQVFAVRGLHPDMTSIVSSSASQLNGSAQNIARPALTVTDSNCLIVLAWWKQDDSTTVTNDVTFQGGPTDGSSTTGDDASTGADIFTQSAATSYSSGTLTVTGGAAAISRCMMVALKPIAQATWTTNANDYPINLDVGGVKITATACSDDISPQTMTISAAPVARTSGVPVKLWNPAVLVRDRGITS